MYRARIRLTTTTTGPAHRITASLYKTMVQNPARNRKLCQGSPVVHVNSPTSVFKGRMNGCEYASVRVISGGVATRRGDLRCTMTLERRLEVKEEPEMVVGENAATVDESDWEPLLR